MLRAFLPSFPLRSQPSLPCASQLKLVPENLRKPSVAPCQPQPQPGPSTLAQHHHTPWPRAPLGQGGQAQLPASIAPALSPAWLGSHSRARAPSARLTALSPCCVGCLWQRLQPLAVGRGASRKGPFPLCPAGFTLCGAGTMRGSGLRGERGQARGQRGPRREISPSEGHSQLPSVPTLPPPPSRGCLEGTPWGQARFVPAQPQPQK